uniref:AB hydrolase-1 domain-containing protein n=1 Tax=Chromera velia CCMP2878 TaxID=1169474 RepID=A0A0G4GR45_9ALVE|eukprot:Cvel_5081.t1-p1 / transcript=Cvel_5081.t1 / gene=Cvel_5081 / organism=Chromera_velia_CCMP2878 / gene_product=hypothetical protein / transcript_product=hypothetical protein / location=Cvel_scaffold231:80220-83924(-) / protein_length=604 / sequence_SO=supercontig / SO=protein_coding / is_pseudo=false
METAGEQPLFAYCHGWLSSKASVKGNHLASFFDKCTDEHGGKVKLELLDLNDDDEVVGTMTLSSALSKIDAFYARHGVGQKKKMCLIGSSLGGYTAALYASRHPERVSRLVLLCPAFNFRHQLEHLLSEGQEWTKGSSTFETWRRDGVRRFEAPDKRPEGLSVSFDFVRDLEGYQRFPDFSSPSLILHGEEDEVIPVETSLKAVGWDAETVTQRAAEEGREGTKEKRPERESVTSLWVTEGDHALASEQELRWVEKAVKTHLGLREEKKKQGKEQADDGAGEREVPGDKEVIEEEVEVEMKVDVGGRDAKSLMKTLKSAGAVLQVQWTFEDAYFDLCPPGGTLEEMREGMEKEKGGGAFFPLSSTCHFLRRRAGIWELKIPERQEDGGGGNGLGGEGEGDRLTVYREVTKEEEIAKYARETFFPDTTERASMDQLVKEAGLRPFVVFRTRRRKLKLPSEFLPVEAHPDSSNHLTLAVGVDGDCVPVSVESELSVDVDEASFGPLVMEIEKLERLRVSLGSCGKGKGERAREALKGIKGEAVGRAGQDVRRICEQLGLSRNKGGKQPGGGNEETRKSVKGKVEEYVWRKSPGLYRFFVQKGAFAP